MLGVPHPGGEGVGGVGGSRGGSDRVASPNHRRFRASANKQVFHSAAASDDDGLLRSGGDKHRSQPTKSYSCSPGSSYPGGTVVPRPRVRGVK